MHPDAISILLACPLEHLGIWLDGCLYSGNPKVFCSIHSHILENRKLDFIFFTPMGVVLAIK